MARPITLPAFNMSLSEDDDEQRRIREEAERQALASLEGAEMPTPDGALPQGASGDLMSQVGAPPPQAPPTPPAGPPMAEQATPAGGPASQRPRLVEAVGAPPEATPQPASAPVAQQTAGAPSANRQRVPGMAPARARQRFDDGLNRMLSGVVRSATEGRATLDLPGSTAMQDFLTEREAGRQDRAEVQDQNRLRRQEQRQAGLDTRQAEQHVARMQTVQLEAERLEQQVEAARTDEALRGRLMNPQSQESQNMRAIALETIDNLETGAGIPDAPQMDLADLRQAVEGQSAWQLANNQMLEDRLKYYSQLRLGLSRQRRTVRGQGGGGGRYSSGGGEGEGPAPMTDLWVQDFASTRNVDPSDPEVQAQAQQIWDQMSGKDRSAYVSTMARSVGGNTAIEGRTQDREGVRREMIETRSRIPGYERAPNAPEISTTEMREARELVGTTATIRQKAQQLGALQEQASAAQRAGAAAGVLDDLMAQARVLHEQMTVDLRNAGNYGVPQAAELARMESIAPRLDSIQGFLSAGPQYRAIAQAYTQNTDRFLQSAYGYRRAQQGGGQGARVRVRGPNGQVGSVPRGVPLPQGWEAVDG